jgi:hypothetical protein
MRSEVSITFKDRAPVRIDLDGLPPMSNEEARAWLDQQFTRMECEPLRPTGKLLTAGSDKFADAAWAQAFARAASAALAKPMVHIDVAALSISY